MSTTTIRSYDGDAATHTTDESTSQETAKNAPQTCPECGGDLAQHDARGETACVDCGLVVSEDDIDHGPEWRAFDSAEKDQKSRVGAPTTNMMHDKGLSTNIGWQDQDANGNSLSSRQRQKMQRLRTWNERFRTQNSKERNLKQALAEIERMGSALGQPENVRETASVVYRRALDEDLLPGRSIEGVATAALYAAGRQANHPRSIKEVANVSRVDDMEFKRTYRYIVRELGLAVAPADPTSYVGRIASELDLDDDVERRARELLDTASGTGTFNGKSPVGLAAAAIYAAGRLTGDRYTQDDVAAAADISTVTIRNRYQELLEVAEDADAA
jgi:transcription initiation factor TFIIB